MVWMGRRTYEDLMFRDKGQWGNEDKGMVERKVNMGDLVGAWSRKVWAKCRTRVQKERWAT